MNILSMRIHGAKSNCMTAIRNTMLTFPKSTATISFLKEVAYLCNVMEPKQCQKMKSTAYQILKEISSSSATSQSHYSTEDTALLFTQMVALHS